MAEPEQRRQRWLSPVAAAVVVAALLVAFGLLSSDQRSTAAGPHYFDPTTVPTQPPGRPLRDGFSVAPGSALIGALFPVLEDSQQMAEEGSGPIVSWRAQLLLTGDPLEVFNTYVAQALAAGFPIGTSCSVQDFNGLAVPLADYDQASAELLECSAGYQQSSRPNKSSSYLSIRLAKGISRGLFVSHVSLRRVTIGDGTGEDLGLGYGDQDGPISARVPTLPESPPVALGQSGDLLLPGGGDVDLRLPAGTEQIAPAAGSVVCSLGTDVVLTAAGSGVDVLSDFRAQVMVSFPADLEIRGSVEGEATVNTVTLPSRGGNQGMVITSVDIDGQTFIMVTLC